MTITTNNTKLDRRINNRRESDLGLERINRCIHTSMINYFKDMEGHTPGNLYDLVLAEMEKPLLEVVLQQTDNNLTKASQILGLNRGTLRKKITKYGLSK